MCTQAAQELTASYAFHSSLTADSRPVRCFGTEDRPADVFMPPLEHPFNLVEFNVSDLHDLTFEDVPPSTSAPPQVNMPFRICSHISPR